MAVMYSRLGWGFGPLHNWVFLITKTPGFGLGGAGQIDYPFIDVSWGLHLTITTYGLCGNFPIPFLIPH